MNKLSKLIFALLIVISSIQIVSAQITACDSLVGTGTTVSNLPNGIYHVAVTDGNGCSQIGTVYVSTTYNFSIYTDVLQNNSCTSNNQGQASVTASGPGPFTYHWSSGSNSSTASNLATGTHTVTVTGSSGCVQTASAYISKSNLAVSANSLLSNSCSVPNQGYIEAYAPNGAPPYTYLWNTGSTQIGLSNMPNGTYSVTVTDADNCSGTASGAITTQNDLTAYASTLTQNSCTGTNQGAVTVYASGGEPLAYHWSTGSTNQTVYNLPNGTYTVTVTNSTGCSQTSSVNLVSSNNIVMGISTNQRNNCTSHNLGSLSVSAFAGTPFTAYHWSNGATTASITGLDNGTYTVTVTNSSGCTMSETTYLYADNPLNIFYSTVQNNQCPATHQGQVTVSASGQPPYSYNWYRQIDAVVPVINVNGQLLTSTLGASYQWYLNASPINGATNQTYYATATGYYTVNVTYSNGCSMLSNIVTISAISGLEDIANQAFQIYPNPSNGKVTIVLPVEGSEILVSDLLGSEVKRISSTEKINEFELEQSGVYLVTIKTKLVIRTQKLVVTQ